jgi:hypothetical protein
MDTFFTGFADELLKLAQYKPGGTVPGMTRAQVEASNRANLARGNTKPGVTRVTFKKGTTAKAPKPPALKPKVKPVKPAKPMPELDKLLQGIK